MIQTVKPLIGGLMGMIVGVLLSTMTWGAELRTVIVSDGNQNETRGFTGTIYCSGTAYKLVEKVIDGPVVKSYLFVASNAPAIDAWLYTDTGQIIGEVHRITASKPGTEGMHYWEAERDFGIDSVYVYKVWILVACYPPGTYVEPYAIVWARVTP